MILTAVIFFLLGMLSIRVWLYMSWINLKLYKKQIEDKECAVEQHELRVQETEDHAHMCYRRVREIELEVEKSIEEYKKIRGQEYKKSRGHLVLVEFPRGKDN